MAIGNRIKDKERISLSKKSIVSVFSSVLMFVFLLSSLILPSYNFQIKKISFVLLMLINILTFLEIRNTLINRYFIFYGFTYVALIIVMSIFVRQGAIISVILRGYSGFLLLLYFIVVRQKINYEKMLMICLTAMALIIFLSILLDLTKIITIFKNPLLKWLYNTNNAMLGKGKNVSFYYLIFLKSSPLILMLLLFSINKRKLILSIIALVAIIFSGTRANALVAVGILGLYILLCEKNKTIKYMAILGIFAIIVLFGNDIYDFLIRIFERKESSDAVRSGHIESLFELFKQSPNALIWGTGFDSEIFSKGVNAYVTTLELSYWDFLRQVGLIGFIPFMIFLIYPIIALFDTTYRWLSLAYLGFLIISYTNPFLYGSTGYIIYIYVYLVLFTKAKPISITINNKSLTTKVKV